MQETSEKRKDEKIKLRAIGLICDPMKPCYKDFSSY
uniref:Uncharacterized protein n=1 Tax=Tetranychus urticae TaxID=32264 RepID=T1K7L6_TETUR